VGNKFYELRQIHLSWESI